MEMRAMVVDLRVDVLAKTKGSEIKVALVTGGQNDHEAVDERQGRVLDGNSPAGACDTANAVEVAAQLRHQIPPRLPYCLPCQRGVRIVGDGCALLL
jgi:hypothetical protein